jgi:hypothetical protein
MTPAASRHLDLERDLEMGRVFGALTEVAEDALLEEMGDLWYEMSEDEQQEANRRAAATASRRASHAPLSFDGSPSSSGAVALDIAPGAGAACTHVQATLTTSARHRCTLISSVETMSDEAASQDFRKELPHAA